MTEQVVASYRPQLEPWPRRKQDDRPHLEPRPTKKRADRPRWLDRWRSAVPPRAAGTPPPGPRGVVGVCVRWLGEHRYEILAVLLIVAVGSFLRIYRLDSVPNGVHGDEATNALYADRILNGEWAQAFDSLHARGRPAGFLYWLAGITALFGDSLFVLRMAAVVLSILTIPAAYFLFRVIDGRATALIGASLLALSNWHLQYSRVAWEPPLLVLAQVVAALFLVLALRSGKRWLFAVAGIALGLGFYTHSSYPFFLLGVVVLLAFWLPAQRANFRRALVGSATLVAAFLLTALPMLSFIRTHEEIYFRPARSESIFNLTRFEEASGLLERADVVLDSGRNFVKLAVFGGRPGLAQLALPTSLLLGLGLLYAGRRLREPGVALAAILVLVLPWAGILYPGGEGPTLRRTVGVTPFIALLAAFPLAAALRSTYLSAPYLRALGVFSAVAIIVSVGVINGSDYFREFAPRSKVNYSIMHASRFLNDLPAARYVYYYSARWPFDYEVRRYLAGDVEGEDRSGFSESTFDLTPDRTRDVVYLFLDSFLDRSDEVQRLFPGGRAFDFRDNDGTVLFRTYELPRDPTLPPPAVARDLARQQDLSALEEALERYREQNGSYPDTAGKLQSLCVYRELDAGCALGTVLSPVPQDPLGNPGANGYWYVSDGTSFAVFAQRETDRVPECSDRGGPALKLASLLCVRGP